jgi:hypothetical protein
MTALVNTGGLTTYEIPRSTPPSIIQEKYKDTPLPETYGQLPSLVQTFLVKRAEGRYSSQAETEEEKKVTLTTGIMQDIPIAPFPFNILSNITGATYTEKGGLPQVITDFTPHPLEISPKEAIVGPLQLPQYGKGITPEEKETIEKSIADNPISNAIKDIKIDLPDFGDIGKWLLIGGGLLLAILILPKLIPQRE